MTTAVKKKAGSRTARPRIGTKVAFDRNRVELKVPAGWPGEMYDHVRFFTVTGRVYSGLPGEIYGRQGELN
jgi:hypothetical protein